MLADGSSVRLLDVDPDLGQGLAEGDLARAATELVVRTGQLPPGSWEPPILPGDGDGYLGLLVLEGLLTRETAVAQTTCAELVGSGDLLRPWERLGEQAPMPYEVEWNVLEPTRVAILDRRAVEIACRWPALMTAVIARTTARVHALALSLAITCITGVRIRLLVLLWHLADRWGRVRADGVLVPLQLTHETLGKLVGARRPSVSTALGELQTAALIERRDDGWVLYGDPPHELQQMHERRRAVRGRSAAA